MSIIGPMYQPFAKVNHKLRIGLCMALALSAIFAATDIPWLSLEVGAGIGAFIGATAMLWLPYLALYALLAKAKEFPRFQIVSFVVVVLPACMLLVFRMSKTQTGGWEYFVVPFWQLVLHAILFYVLKALVSLQRRHANAPSD